MRMTKYDQFGYPTLDNAIPSAIKCYREFGNTHIINSGEYGCYIVFRSDDNGIFDEPVTHHTITLEDVTGNMPVPVAFIKLTGIFKYLGD